MTLTKCPDCGGELEEGAIMDFTYGGVGVERYGKTTVPTEQKLALVTEANFQDIRRVISYRCVKCNRLFSYTQDIVLGKSIWHASRKNYQYLVIFLIIIFVFIFLLAMAPR